MKNYDLQPVVDLLDESIAKLKALQSNDNEEKQIISLLNSMCEESLCPETFEKWEQVMSELESTRSSLK